MIIFLMVITIIIAINMAVSIKLLTSQNKPEQNRELITLQQQLTRIEMLLKDEFSRNRAELTQLVKLFEDSVLNRMGQISTLQKNQLDTFSQQLTVLTTSNTEQLDKMRQTIETKLKLIQDDTNQKLELMRQTVDEKLHKTLEQRLGESFKLVSDRLELVHKGLGEMQSLATGVGDLKKVLSNVKTRGILGEIQLENILEQILTNEQYSKNIVTKKGSNNPVEFAIKLPGRDSNGAVYLPIDSKFPLEAYHCLIEAYDVADVLKIELAQKELEANIRKCAKDIHDKYIDPPNTTDFGIMFLPIEGLYAQVVRSPHLIEVLQRDYKIILTGPTTLSAFLNSLQMGFKTLVIEKRSSEVWQILAAIKTEFSKFGDVLKKTQDKLNQASSDLDDLVGTRTRQIQRKLQNVQDLPLLVDDEEAKKKPPSLEEGF